jgi:biopolymer transport protein TolR
MRPRRLMNQINVVPYIDVMLVLLVIFMVTAPMIQTGSVDLPTVAGVPQPPAEAVRVFVKADGTLAFRAAGEVAERAVTELELLRELNDVLALNPAQSVVVAADKSVAYEKVMDALSGLRGAGVQRVGLETQSGTGAP